MAAELRSFGEPIKYLSDLILMTACLIMLGHCFVFLKSRDSFPDKRRGHRTSAPSFFNGPALHGILKAVLEGFFRRCKDLWCKDPASIASAARMLPSCFRYLKRADSFESALFLLS